MHIYALHAYAVKPGSLYEERIKVFLTCAASPTLGYNVEILNPFARNLQPQAYLKDKHNAEYFAKII